MTNKEAAERLRNMMKYLLPAVRGSGKSMMVYHSIEAYLKAIDLLEKTPDKEDANG